MATPYSPLAFRGSSIDAQSSKSFRDLLQTRDLPFLEGRQEDPMGTIALFITVFILLCIFALIFVCYRAGRDRQAQAALDDADSAALQRATMVLSIVPGSAAAAAFAAQQQQQQPYSSSRPRPGAYPRKTPTPPTIIRNLPVVIWTEKPGKHAHKSSDADDTAQEKDAAAVAGGAVPPAATSTAGSCAGDSDGQQESLCVICCCDFMAGEAVKLLPCMHMYHQACIDAWLERSHVCPVCQADVIRAAGLSAAAGDWSVHTQEAVNVISGVQNHSQPHLGPTPPSQQQQDGWESQQQQQQQQPHVSVSVTPELLVADRQLPPLPVSSPPLSAPTAAAAAGSGQPPLPDSSQHRLSSDAVALVLTRQAAVPGTCTSSTTSSTQGNAAAAASIPPGAAAAGAGASGPSLV